MAQQEMAAERMRAVEIHMGMCWNFQRHGNRYPSRGGAHAEVCMKEKCMWWDGYMEVEDALYWEMQSVSCAHCPGMDGE